MYKSKRLLAFVAFISAVILFAIMQTTTPAVVNPLVIVLVFLLIYIIIFNLLTLVSIIIYNIISRRRAVETQMNYGKTAASCGVVALAPVVVVAMRTIGEVHIYSYLLVGAFVVLGLVYVRRQI